MTPSTREVFSSARARGVFPASSSSLARAKRKIRYSHHLTKTISNRRASATTTKKMNIICASASAKNNNRISCGDAIVNESLTHPPASGAEFDVIVVGNGPLGAAIGLHLSEKKKEKKKILILDSGEESLSSGSDDLGRIVRPLDAEGRDEWTQLNIDSIRSFREIQEESEIEFFEKKGSLSIGSRAFVSRPASLLEAKGIEHEIVKGRDEMCEKFEYLSPKTIPEEYIAVSDRVGGYVSPHKMRAAFNRLAVKNNQGTKVCVQTGEEIIASTTTNKNDDDGFVKVRTTDGNEYVAKETVIVACGYYTQPLLHRSKIDMESLEDVKISKRTIILAKVSEEDAKGRFRDMPTIKYELPESVRSTRTTTDTSTSGTSDQSKNEAKSVYILPPIWYPGPVPSPGYYVKIGGGPNDFMTLSKAVMFDGEKNDIDKNKEEKSPIEQRKELDSVWEDHRKATYEDQKEDIESWMSSDGDPEIVPQLKTALLHVFPDVQFESFETKACATTCTSNGSMKIEHYLDGKIWAVTGCNGKAAGPAWAIAREVVANASL
jgi:glycine/D-amino acid oxidase-like deaminating enzyme